MIELASADQYRDDWKAWKYETLPMIPENWKYQIKESTKGQFRVLKELLHRADITEVICATDLEQQEGRILRQGNQNDKVKIFRYVTENTFDAYMWQILENKQKFISQIMTSKSPVRACEDVMMRRFPMRRSRRWPRAIPTLRKRWIWIYKSAS